MVRGMGPRLWCRSMNPIWNDVARHGFGVDASQLFNVILVYEDLASAFRGLELYQRLVNELGSDGEFSLSLWKFALLAVSRIAEISSKQAVDADLVIVCTRSESTPPEQVQSWFHRWLDMKGHRDCALVVLGDAAPAATAPVQPEGFFHNLARRGGITLFLPTPTHGRNLPDQPGPLPLLQPAFPQPLNSSPP